MKPSGGEVTLSPTRHLERNEMESKDPLCAFNSVNLLISFFIFIVRSMKWIFRRGCRLAQNDRVGMSGVVLKYWL